MRRYPIGSAIAVVVLCVVGIGCIGLTVPPAHAAADAADRRVSVDLDGVTLGDALTSLFKDTDQSFMLHPSLYGEGPIKVRLTNVPFEFALIVYRDDAVSHRRVFDAMERRVSSLGWRTADHD